MTAITIELCAEDRARLDAIIAGLQGKAPAVAPAEVPVADPAPVADFPVVPDQVPWDEAPADPAPAPAPAAKPVSLAEFQKAITLRCAESPKVKAAVRELVNGYAPSVSTIPEDKRSEFLAKLAAI